ncbi:MAG TPA: hypothetical protein V6C99_02355 [Oculatellaceae cyanobacterium]
MLQSCSARERPRAPTGQGVIEYAGALILAAIIVAMCITVLPPNVAAIINNLTSSIFQFFLEQVPT